jgi:hypothetical protein
MPIKRLTLKKILSFKETTVELGPLNVLIGANAVGKSNLIEAISLLQAAPNCDWMSQVLRGGGVRQWLWLGERAPAQMPAEIRMRTDASDALDLELGLPAGFTVSNAQIAEVSRYIVHERLDTTGPASPDEAGVFRTLLRESGAQFGAQAYRNAAENSARTVDVPCLLMSSVLARFKSPVDHDSCNRGRQTILSRTSIFREFRDWPCTSSGQTWEYLQSVTQGLPVGGRRQSGAGAPRTRFPGRT